MLKEFKPTFIFLAKFLGIYLAGNIIYGIFVESYDQRPDPVTKLVSTQSAYCLRGLRYDATIEINPKGPTVFITNGSLVILNVYEGCNGINVMIVFVAFVVAFRGSLVIMSWFIPLGLALIHGFNLLRIMFLFYLAEHNAKHFYYFHKYWFTAVLYLAVFCLWAIWIKINHGSFQTRATAPLDKN